MTMRWIPARRAASTGAVGEEVHPGLAGAVERGAEEQPVAAEGADDLFAQLGRPSKPGERRAVVRRADHDESIHPGIEAFTAILAGVKFRVG
jgi:hypothetical protein